MPRIPSDLQSQQSSSIMFTGFGANKSKMSKQAMAAFMKAKLAQTKISSETKTAKSASGPAKTNFNGPKPPQKPTPTPTQKQAAKKIDDDGPLTEDDIRAAAAAMNRPIVRQGSSQGPRAPSKAKTSRPSSKVQGEEHKSRVINTSKSIYKPCFNLPPKDTSKPTPPAKKEGPPKT